MSHEFELSREELSAGEVREILDRLGQDEMGGPDVARVRDVAEATGTSVQTIGRILADIRKEDWEDKFGKRQSVLETTVDEHSKKLQRHGELLERVKEPSESVLGKHTDEEIYEAVQNVEREKRRAQLPALVATLIGMGFFFLILHSCLNPPANSLSRSREGVGYGFDGYDHRWQNGRWESRPQGTNEPFQYDAGRAAEAESFHGHLRRRTGR